MNSGEAVVAVAKATLVIGFLVVLAGAILFTVVL